MFPLFAELSITNEKSLGKEPCFPSGEKVAKCAILLYLFPPRSPKFGVRHKKSVGTDNHNTTLRVSTPCNK